MNPFLRVGHLGVWRWEHTPTFRGYDSFGESAMRQHLLPDLSHFHSQVGYYGGGEDYYQHGSEKLLDFHFDSRKECGEGCSEPLFTNQSNPLFSYPRFIAASGGTGAVPAALD